MCIKQLQSKAILKHDKYIVSERNHTDYINCLLDIHMDYFLQFFYSREGAATFSTNSIIYMRYNTRTGPLLDGITRCIPEFNYAVIKHVSFLADEISQSGGESGNRVTNKISYNTRRPVIRLLWKLNDIEAISHYGDVLTIN